MMNRALAIQTGLRTRPVSYGPPVPPGMVSKKVVVPAVLSAAILCLILGVMLGRFGFPDTQDEVQEVNPYSYLVAATREEISRAIVDEVNPDSISGYLRNFTNVPHLAGTPQDLEQAEWVRDEWLKEGLDSVEILPYEVLLSFPNRTAENKVYIVNDVGGIEYTSHSRQPPLWDDAEFHELVPPNFNAYSATGTVEGEVVYANYGQESDYKYLEEQGVSLENKIVLARYGKIFRANIVKFAEERGAVGVILFSDPADKAKDGPDINVYPNSIWVPGLGAELGTVLLSNGDPLTPLYPSIESAYRIPEAEADIPRIPVQPIGYTDAEQILRQMSPSSPAPDDWQGGLNLTYCIGPGFENPSWLLRLQVFTYNQRVNTYNVIGIMRGSVEPDRYVVVGNHRDAWILGASDPSSSSAGMMELVRVFMKIKQEQGWTPRRSIVFCSWGAEEHGLMGSMEWTEHKAKVLGSRAIAYLNVDMIIEGNYSLRALGVPLLYQPLYDAARVVPNPDPDEVAAGRLTVFDTWLHSFPGNISSDLPQIKIANSGSDYVGFIHVLGIPCIDISYVSEIGSLPLYHTLYESYNLISEVLDRGFHFHVAVTQMWAELARNLADSLLLPFDVRDYGTHLERSFADIQDTYGSLMEENGASLLNFEESVNRFQNAAINFHDTVIENIDTSNPMELRRVNDQLMNLERSFVDKNGLPGRPDVNHVVFAPSTLDSYSSEGFAGLVDLLHDIENLPPDEQTKRWEAVKHHLSVIAYIIDGATSLFANDV